MGNIWIHIYTNNQKAKWKEPNPIPYYTHSKPSPYQVTHCCAEFSITDSSECQSCVKGPRTLLAWEQICKINFEEHCDNFSSIRCRVTAWPNKSRPSFYSLVRKTNVLYKILSKIIQYLWWLERKNNTMIKLSIDRWMDKKHIVYTME